VKKDPLEIKDSKAFKEQLVHRVQLDLWDPLVNHKVLESTELWERLVEPVCKVLKDFKVCLV